MATKSHIPCLDGLRAVAVLLVIWTHVPAGVLGENADWLRPRIQAGYLGVDIFFVLSGFLITRILLVDRARGRPLRHFLARRFLRIFPIYYLTLALLAVLQPGPELPWCALYLSNVYFPLHPLDSPLRHTWSLSVEEHFYMVWPLCVYLLSRRASQVVLWIGFIAVALGGAALTLQATRIGPLASLIESWIADGLITRWSPKDLLYQFTAFRALSLALGALLAFGEDGLRARRQRWLALSLLVLLLSVVVRNFVGVKLFGLHWYPLTRLTTNALISTCLVLGVLCLDEIGGWTARLLDNPPLRYIGRISYGLYLYHYPIFHALQVRKGAPDLGTNLPLALALTFASAALSYALLERPLLAYANRFRGAPTAAS